MEETKKVGKVYCEDCGCEIDVRPEDAFGEKYFCASCGRKRIEKLGKYSTRMTY